MKVTLLEPARDELGQAAHYYNIQRPGLGREFREEVRAAIARMKTHPWAWQEVAHEVRHCIIRRFPYGVIYRIVEDEIVIIAVAHLHREPEYWEGRTSSEP